MNKEHFTTLLEDLYTRYNHTKISEVPAIVEKYNGQEFDAIKTVYFKYNHPRNVNYDPKAGTDSYIKNLIADYSKGERPLKNIKKELSESEAFAEQLETAKQEWKSSFDKAQKDLEVFVNEQKEYFKQYELELKLSFSSASETLDRLLKEKEKEVIAFMENFDEQVKSKLSTLTPQEPIAKIDLAFTLSNSDMEIDFPKGIENLAVGSRFLMSGLDGKPIGFEIKDIFLDYVSNPEKPVKEITIEKI